LPLFLSFNCSIHAFVDMFIFSRLFSRDMFWCLVRIWVWSHFLIQFTSFKSFLCFWSSSFHIIWKFFGNLFRYLLCKFSLFWRYLGLWRLLMGTLAFALRS
jgi:hypothetical protein